MLMGCALGRRSTVMNQWKRSALTLLQDERGQDLVEYALVAALVALAAIAAVSRVGSAASSLFISVGSKITTSV
jgi:pilus assembly protein Flp/PilA